MLKLLNTPNLGIDVGTRKISGVKLKRKGGRVLLEDYFFYDLSKVGDSTPDASTLPETLHGLIETHKLQHMNTAASLPDEKVICFELKLPSMPKNEVPLAIRSELESRLQTSADDVRFDFVNLDKDAQDRREIRVLVFCTTKDTVNERLQLLKDANLRPLTLESDIIAHTATLEFNGYLERGTTHLIVDLGESHTTIGYLVNGVLRATKTAEIGQGLINKVLNEKMGMSYAEAEKLKLKYDFNNKDGGQAEAMAHIDEVYYQIFKVIKESIEFFTEHVYLTNNLDQIFLVGGGSQQANMKSVFEMFFRTPTTIVNPFKNIDIYAGTAGETPDNSVGSVASHMSTAVGLALRRFA